VANQSEVPIGIDVNTPNVARMWDYQLGGKDNFAADREAAEMVNEAMRRVNSPDGRAVARENRAFLQRAVRFLAGEAQIGQFIDIGAGLPTQGNVHQAAHEVAPQARVVYADYDPVVVVHGQALLTGTDKTTVIHADLRQPDKILNDPELRRMIDLGQPVAILLIAVLHLLTDDDDPVGVVTQLRDAMAPGSYLVVTHATRQTRPAAATALSDEFKRLRVTTPIVPRSREEIERFFDGFDLVEPGLVFPALWHPDTAPAQGDAGAEWMFAGVGRKR
jgi:hypothetical protein